MFVGLIQRCEQIAMPTMTLSQATDVFDERFYALPNLLDALSAIIIEMTNVRSLKILSDIIREYFSDW